MNQYLPSLLVCLLFGFQSIMAQNDNQIDFFNSDQIQEIKIKFDSDQWQYSLDSLRYNGANLLIGEAEINGEMYKNIGVRWRGTRSFTRGAKRNGLNIKLDYINRSQKIQGHGTLKLSKALRDPSLLREVMSYEIARKYMPAPRANYTRVYINDEFYGLFVNVEAIDDAFLKKHFGSNDGALFKANQNAGDNEPVGCKNELYGSLEYENSATCYLNNFEIESKDGWDELIKLTETLNDDSKNISDILNIDRTLWMLAYNNVLGNLSSYSGKNSVNYYLYQDESGQFNPIIWDMNLSFGSLKSAGDGSDLNSQQMQELDPLLHVDNPYKPLISKLLANDFYQKLYLSHVRQIMRENFYNGDYKDRAKALQSLIRNDFVHDSGNRYKIEDFDNSLDKTIGKRSKIPGIVQYMSKRTSFLNKYPKVMAVPPKMEQPEVEKRAQLSSGNISSFKIRVKSDRFTDRMKIVYRLNGTGDFMEKDIKDDGKNNDGAAKDGMYCVTITPTNGEKTIEYYIWAENPSMISFSPANYMFQKHTASLEELNK